MSRLLVNRSNVKGLTLASVTTPTRSDELFQGAIKHKALADGIELFIDITATGGNPTIASLGDFTLESTQDGKLFTIPLRFWATVCPFLGLPTFIASGTGYYKIYIPIPFGIFQGVRAKDTFLVAEKCNDYFIEITGAAEAGLTYTKYNFKPIIMGEANNNVYIPSEGPIYFKSETIPAGSWYRLKANHVGPTFIAFCKSDYANFVATDMIRLYVDGKLMQEYDAVHDMNRVFQYIRQRQGHHIAADTTPDNLLTMPLLNDKKAAKISRSSIYEIEYYTAVGFTIWTIAQCIKPLTSNQGLRLAQRQNPNIADDDPSIRPTPIDTNGKPNPYQKALSRKVYVTRADGEVERVANRA